MIEQWVEAHREGLLAFAAKLVATPSPNPPGDERAVAEVILNELSRLESGDIRPNREAGTSGIGAR